MDIVDGPWIENRLTGARGEKAALARATGLTPTQISYIMAGTRTVSQEEAASIRAFFGAAAPAGEAQGFGEPAVEPLTAAHKVRADRIAALAAGRGRHPITYRISGAIPAFDICEGDLLIADLKATPRAGELVVCTLTDLETGHSETRIRKWFEPWLIGDHAADRIDETGHAAILGGVIALVRGVLAA